ncbi:MAG TPA: GNAT family N-acetyltransferase [Nocardioidaceae bacterium]|nr:GNAT family N-acetyltransferase [Nocardioidaceae bacterium]
MRIRNAVPDDVDALTALDRDTFGRDAWSRASMESELFGRGLRSVVAERDGILGYAITRSAGDLTDLQRIVVRPEDRRQGLARRLLRVVLDGYSMPQVLLEVRADNAAALAFYAAEGFVELDRRAGYYRDGTDAVVMRREMR